MKLIKFEREVKVLLNGVRAYGIQHTQYPGRLQKLLKDANARGKFIQSVHNGFYLTQKNCVRLLKLILQEKRCCKKNLKDARRERDKGKCDEITKSLNQAVYQEMVVRKVMDSIAWQLFGQDLTTMRRLYYGQELIDITDSNLDSELAFVENYMKENPGSFVLISDLTSFIQIGDVVIVSPDKGISLCELKEGKANQKVFQIIKEAAAYNCPYFLHKKLESEDKKFQEQFWRDVRQLNRNVQVEKTIHTGEGKDLLTDINVRIIQDEMVLGTYRYVIEELLTECNKKGYAIQVIEGCLLIGVYMVSKFPDDAFDLWAKGLRIRMPVVDFRSSMFDPLSFPVFLQEFPDSCIMDIIMGRKVVKFALDIDKWLETFVEDGFTYRWMSKKETARINGKFKGKSGIFSIDGRGIELCSKEGIVQQLGSGIFSRMFTSLNTPSSIERFLTAGMEKAAELKQI